MFARNGNQEIAGEGGLHAELAQAQGALADTQRIIDVTRTQLAEAQTALAEIGKEMKQAKGDKVLKKFYADQAPGYIKQIEIYNQQLVIYNQQLGKQIERQERYSRCLEDLTLGAMSNNLKALSFSGTSDSPLSFLIVISRNTRKSEPAIHIVSGNQRLLREVYWIEDQVLLPSSQRTQRY